MKNKKNTKWDWVIKEVPKHPSDRTKWVRETMVYLNKIWDLLGPPRLYVSFGPFELPFLHFIYLVIGFFAVCILLSLIFKI
jgi:hypothetical protein